MVRQISILSRIQLCNLFGLNELRYTKDHKKRQRGLMMLAAYLLVGIMLVGYMISMTMGLISLGMEKIVPMYLYFIISILIFFLLIFKAGSVMFQMSSYQQLSSFPISKAAIVISRFLAMYGSGLVAGLLLMFPCLVVYGIYTGQSFYFYLYSFLGMVLLPVLPVTLAVILGAGITAVSARTRHKGLVSAVLSIAVVFLCMVFSSLMAGTGEELSMDMTKLHSVLEHISAILTGMFPPAAWFGSVVLEGSFSSVVYLLTASFLPCILTIAVLQRYFGGICAALNVSNAKGNYQVKELNTNGIRKALCMREFRHYISCGVYLANTIIGLLMMAGMGVGLYFAGVETIEKELPIPNLVGAALPFLLGFVAGIAPMTASIISIEGKQWWILQSFPVSEKIILQSKFMIQMLVAVPFYLIGVIFSLLAVKPEPLQAVWMVIIPLLFLGFISMAGLYANISFPVFQWESEVQVVKQSGAVLVTMVIDMVCGLIPMAIGILLPQGVRHGFMALMAVSYAMAVIVLYQKAEKKLSGLLWS